MTVEMGMQLNQAAAALKIGGGIALAVASQNTSSGGGGSATLIEKSVQANGVYDADDDEADGYSTVAVSVPNTYTQADEGKVVSSGALVAQTPISIAANGTYDTTENDEAVVAVPNSYTASDEGKVVSSGALVAQTSLSVTENDTYDTTLYDEVTVNVQGGGTPTLISKTITQNGTYDANDDNADGYSEVTVNVAGSQIEVVITPIGLGDGSFISTSAILSIGKSAYPSYKAIAVELDSLPDGMLVTIENNGNRNYWGLYDSITDGAQLKGLNARQEASGGVLQFYPDDFRLFAAYLVYDYTSSSEGLPTVKAVSGGGFTHGYAVSDMTGLIAGLGATASAALNQ